MADILISKFTTQIPRVGATPATPGFAESEGQDPVAPSGTPQVYTPVTIGSPANGLSISGTKVLTIGLASTSTTGALSSTDWNTFNGKLNLTSPITGYTVGANTALADTDTILQAFGKVQGQINARISGTIASGQVAFGTGVNTVEGSSNLTFDSANIRFSIGGSTDPNSRLTLTRNSSGANIRLLSLANIAGTVNSGVDLKFTISADINSGAGGIIRSVRTNAANSGDSYLAFLPSLGVIPTEIMRINPNGQVWINTTSGTNTLDVNGTARIRTISNLGSAATSVLVPSATGVVSLRTLAEFASDAGLTPLSGLTTNRFIKATSATTVGNTGVTEESTISYLFGTRTGLATATPLCVSLGGTFGNNTVGAEGNSKIKLFDGGSGTSYGIGLSGNLMEFSTPSGAGFAFFPNRTRQLTILDGGNVGFGTATPSQRIHVVGNVLIQSTGSGLQFLSLSDSFGVATPGNNSNIKLRLFDNGAGIVYGLGISGSLMEITSPSGADIGFFPANTRSMTVLSNGNLSFEAGKNIQFATTTGTQIGTATNQRLAFYGSTPIVKPSGDILTALSNLGLITSPTITQVDQFAVKTTASADQTLPSGVLTILDYDTTLTNNSTATYTVGTTGRITINTTGIYTITAGVVIEADAVTALESAFLGIFRNGDLVAISSINTTIAAGAQSGLSTSTILSLTATDIIDCRALVNSVGGVANGLARRLGTLLGANATQVNSLSITKNSM